MEKYLISKAKDIADIHASKSWIITAKSLYPNDFSVQFSAYQVEKSTNNYLEAANCFSYIVMNFQNQNQPELWNEISKLTNALRVPEESGGTSEQEFYIKMFQHISYDVQHKILLLTANNSDNNLDHCRLILLLLKRFPQAISTHAPRLLETLVQGMKTPTSSNQFREILVLEALPLIFHKPPELESHLVNRIMAIAFEHYITKMFKESDDSSVTNDSWKNIFEILELCGKILKWEQFLPFNKNWNKDVYWQKLIQIVSSSPPRPSENKQILFCATILFVFSLQDYMKNVKQKNGDTEMDFILVEGFSREIQSDNKRRKIDPILETPKISVSSGCHSDTPGCLVTAAHCWQLLHSNEILQIDFSQLLLNLPVSIWINRFLFDLAVYLGHGDEIAVLLKGPTAANMGVYEKNLRLLSLAQNQGTINSQTFDIILSCLSDLPKQTGCFVDNLIVQTKGRHLTLLPLTKRSILQYCTKMIISLLKPKILDPSCSNTTLGNILVLLQLDWPNEIPLAENIFEIIRNRRSFTYLLFPTYIINMDFIEEFMNMWYPHGGEINLEFMPPQSSVGQTRRIGTRGADKNTKEDFKQIIKQQITKSNDDIDLIIIQFIQQERNMIIQTAFDQ